MGLLRSLQVRQAEASVVSYCSSLYDGSGTTPIQGQAKNDRVWQTASTAVYAMSETGCRARVPLPELDEAVVM